MIEGKKQRGRGRWEETEGKRQRDETDGRDRGEIHRRREGGK